MRVQILFVITFAVYSVFAGPAIKNEQCGKRVAVGGKTENWPWLVSFFYQNFNRYFCGGSLISNRHVLSGKKRNRQKDRQTLNINNRYAIDYQLICYDHKQLIQR